MYRSKNGGGLPGTGYSITINGESTVKWPAKCDHYLSYGLLASCITQQNSHRATRAKNDLAEACPHPNCRVIRTYDLRNGFSRDVYNNIEPHNICAGPGSTLLVCDWKTRKILHLMPQGRKFLCNHDLSVQFFPVQGMCYASSNNAVVFSKVDTREVFAISLATGEVIWKHSVYTNDPANHIPLTPEDVCCTGQGIICVANGTNVLILRSATGDLASVLDIKSVFQTDEREAATSARQTNGLSNATVEELMDDIQNFIQADEREAATLPLPTPVSSRYSFVSTPSSSPPSTQSSPMSSPPSPHYSSPPSSPSPSPSPVSSSSSSSQPLLPPPFQGIHKVMFYESAEGPNLAVRYNEGTIVRFKLSHLPEGRIVLAEN